MKAGIECSRIRVFVIDHVIFRLFVRSLVSSFVRNITDTTVYVALREK